MRLSVPRELKVSRCAYLVYEPERWYFHVIEVHSMKRQGVFRSSTVVAYTDLCEQVGNEIAGLLSFSVKPT